MIVQTFFKKFLQAIGLLDQVYKTIKWLCLVELVFLDACVNPNVNCSWKSYLILYRLFCKHYENQEKLRVTIPRLTLFFNLKNRYKGNSFFFFKGYYDMLKAIADCVVTEKNEFKNLENLHEYEFSSNCNYVLLYVLNWSLRKLRFCIANSVWQ